MAACAATTCPGGAPTLSSAPTPASACRACRLRRLIQPDSDSSIRPLTLIDIDDIHHPHFGPLFVGRFMAYYRKGWPHPLLDAASFRVTEFLRKRPAGREKGRRDRLYI